MPFFGTVLLLASLVSFIMIPLSVGHGLAVGNMSYVFMGLGYGVLGAALVFVLSKVVRKDASHG
jgi:hypothetical protein